MYLYAHWICIRDHWVYTCTPIHKERYLSDINQLVPTISHYELTSCYPLITIIQLLTTRKTYYCSWFWELSWRLDIRVLTWKGKPEEADRFKQLLLKELGQDAI